MLSSKTPADDEKPLCKTMMEIIESRDDLSMLHELIKDVPFIWATLHGKNFTAEDGSNNKTLDLGSMEPLRDEQGAHFVDTFFTPNDEAILALLDYVSIPNNTSDPVDNATRRQRAMKELLGKGNQTVAVNFIAYHVVPDRGIKLPELKKGELLNTALGGRWRLMADRVKKHEGDHGKGAVVIRSMGSQAGILEGGIEACNGVLFVVDRVLLPVDLDGEMNDEQTEHAERIEEAMEAERQKQENGRN